MTDNAQMPAYTVRAAREHAAYDIGEQIDFALAVAKDAPCTVAYSLTWDGADVIRQGTVEIPSGGTIFSVVPDRPGIVRLTLESDPPVEAAAAVAPEHIKPSLPIPEDFDKAWSDLLATQCNAAFGSELEVHSERNDGITYAVTLSVRGIDTIYGWLHRPRGGGRFPALVRYHGAGVYKLPAENGTDWAERGVMVLSINPQSIPNDQPQEFYVGLREGRLADYRQHPEAFIAMFRRAVAAVDFMASLPEWDGRHLIAEGHSQGGGQALAAAGMNPRVTALVASCPTHCDHTGRPAGWPQILSDKADSERMEQIRLIDGVNFASRIACPALFGICFLDSLCPPTGVFAAYNALRGPKSAHYEPTTGHVYTEAFQEATYRWVETLLSEGRPV